MKKKLFGVALFLGLGFGLSQPISAQDTMPDDSPNNRERMGRKDRVGKMRGERRGGRGAMMGGLRELNLTDAQREQIRSIRQNSRDGKESREELRTLMQARRDGTLTADQQDRLRQLREEKRADGENMRRQILAILTPEQRQQWEQMRENGRDRFNERREERRRNRQRNDPTDN